MVHFIPTLYEDELVYSMFARYHIYSGNQAFSLSFQDLYGGIKGVTPSVELQSNLDTLVANLPIGSNLITSDYLIQNHTLFPFYAAFVPKERAEESIGIIKKGNLSTVYPKLGIISNRNGNSTSFLWHCPDCYEEDIREHGESYWHRIHQIPGIDVCLKHRRPLCRSIEPVSGKNRQRIILPMPEEISWEDRAMDNFLLEKKLFVARKSKQLFEAEYKFHDPYYTKKVYISTLIDNNLAYGNGMVKKKELKSRIIDFWGSDFLSQVGLLVKGDETKAWVDRMVNNSKIIVNPLAHIIICEALQISLIDLLSSSITIKNHMKIWEDGIIRSALNGLSLRDIASKHNTTRLTIQKVIKRREIEVKWESNGGIRNNYTGTEKFKGLRENKRKEFLNIIKENTSISVSHFRRKNDTLYSWLQRYDKEWYDENKKFSSSKVNLRLWEERDQKYLPMVQNVVESMKNGYPIRITYNSVGGALGITTWLYSKNMVNTTSYLDSQVEDIDDFWIRRLKWAKEQKKYGIINTSKWDIINIAGISTARVKKLEEHFPELFRF